MIGKIEDENLKQKLISFCVKHFNDYKPKLEILSKDRQEFVKSGA